MKKALAFALACLLFPGTAFAGDVRVVPAPAAGVKPSPLPMLVGGRVLRGGTEAAPTFTRQWPGTYFETEIRGPSAYFKVGPGDVILNVLVDGKAAQRLVKPAPGLYRIDGLGRGTHRLRIEVASESQAGPTSFDGFYAQAGTKARRPRPRARQIEFIGDSHTVGYGNMSATRDCSNEEVWATTDTSKGIAGVTARRYDAEYQVNAISGRGIVRNYDGHPADTLPVAYPYILFDRGVRYDKRDWNPDVIVISLGTNDFTTPLRAAEKWKSREQLHADYEATYVDFVRRLRSRHPKAYFILWATDMAGGEIASEVQKVVGRLQAEGEKRIAFVPVAGLALSGCNYHPSVADDRVVSDALSKVIDSRPGIWRRGTARRSTVD